MKWSSFGRVRDLKEKKRRNLVRAAYFLVRSDPDIKKKKGKRTPGLIQENIGGTRRVATLKLIRPAPSKYKETKGTYGPVLSL
jgi:hypothetical protein